MPFTANIAIAFISYGLGAITGTAGASPPELEAVVVTPSLVLEDPARLPYNTIRFDRTAIQQAPTYTVDDFLRTVPGFSLFRRTSSLVANPTTQGVSLRGIGPSGASRTLILYDGVPLNDAFGGWVTWSRVDLENLAAIEMVEGGGSTLWGNGALGGVIQLLPASPFEPRREAGVRVGTLGTREARFAVNEQVGHWAFGLSGRAFRTDGYVRVEEAQRGPVDVPASSRHERLEAVAGWSPGEQFSFVVRGGWLDEHRSNGTPLTQNETTTWWASVNAIASGSSGQQLKLTGYTNSTSYSQTFSSVNATRQSETLVLDQYDVPSRVWGGGVSGKLPLGDDWQLGGGLDLRWISGLTQEWVVAANGQRRAGGEQWLGGAFLEAAYEPADWLTVTAGLRGDVWLSREGFQQNPHQPERRFANRDETLLSPRTGAVVRLGGGLSWRGAVYQGFRAPTLNELYRPFRLGSDETLANPELSPEKIFGAETALDWAAGAWRASVTAFWNQLRDPITNVTIGVTAGGGALRQRRNLGRAEIKGLEFAIGGPLVPRLSWDIRYLLNDARITAADADPALEGKRLPQVPIHSVSATFTWEAVRDVSIQFQTRYLGPQYEDDLNTRLLGGYTIFNLFAQWQARDYLTVFVAAENLLDRQFVDTISGNGLVLQGTPRLVSAGVRLRF